MVPKQAIRNICNEKIILLNDSKTSNDWWIFQDFSFRYKAKKTQHKIGMTIYFEDSILKIETQIHYLKDIEDTSLRKEVEQAAEYVRNETRKIIENMPKYRLRILTGILSIETKNAQV